MVKASNRTPSCLPGPSPHLVSRYFRTAVILKPPDILEDTSRATSEDDCLPSWPLNVACIEAPNSSSGVSSGFSGVEPNSLPRSPRISFCSVDLPVHERSQRTYQEERSLKRAFTSDEILDGFAQGYICKRLLQFLSYQRSDDINRLHRCICYRGCWSRTWWRCC